MKRIFIIVLMAAGSLTSGACVPGEEYNASNPFNEEFLLLQFLQCMLTTPCSASTTITYVAVGDSDALYYSIDGTTWTSADISGNTSNTFYSVIWDGTNFVAVGENTGSGIAIAYYSSDGSNWTASTFATECTGSADLLDLAYTTGRIVAVGSDASEVLPCIQISLDNGVNWTKASVTNADFLPYPRVVYEKTGGLFVAMATASNPTRAYSSTDGTNFAKTTNGPFAGGLVNTTGDLHYIDTTSRVVYIGQDATTPLSDSSISSDQGNNWTPTPTGVFADDPSNIGRATADDGSTRIVVVGDNCRMDYADDLSSNFTWLHGSAMNSCSSVNWKGLVYHNSNYYAVGKVSSTSGSLGISPAGLGTDWTISSTNSNGLNSITVRQ